MNSIPSVSPAVAPATVELATDPAALTWHGHMADDVAATDGPKPMAMLFATSGELVLSGTRGTYRFPRSEVLGIGRGSFSPWFFGAIRLRHKIPKFPRSLQFKPMDGAWRTVRDGLCDWATRWSRIASSSASRASACSRGGRPGARIVH